MSNTTYNIEKQLDKVILKLDKVITLLQETNKPKPIGLGNPYSTSSGLSDCMSDFRDGVSENEKPFPTPWNYPTFPSCKGDILYKKSENPNWYNIKDNAE